MLKAILIVGCGALIGGLAGYFGKCAGGYCPLARNPWRGMIFGALIGFFFAFSIITDGKEKNTEKHSESLIIINSESDFKSKILNSKLPSLVDFYADWCGPCRSIAPTINALADKYKGKANVAKVNVDKNQKLANQFKVQGIPCIVIIVDGKEVDRLIGARSENDYSKAIEKYLKKEIKETPK